MNDTDKFALVPRQPGAIEKSEPGTKRILVTMVTEALALARSDRRSMQGASSASVDLEAILKRGDNYYFGDGAPQDYIEAMKWFQLAAEGGHPRAQNNVGVCYEHGRGVTKDLAEAVKWYRRSADNGYPRGQANLASCYLEGKGIEKDPEQAVMWYQKAAECGDDLAEGSLGHCYAMGIGVKQNYTQAVEWFRMSAERGNAAAQTWLGVCYLNGQGTPQDFSAAVEWLRKAAEDDECVAQLFLARCYLHGWGVVQDHSEAFKWLRLAAEQGADASQELEKHVNRMTDAEIAEGERRYAEYKRHATNTPQLRQTRPLRIVVLDVNEGPRQACSVILKGCYDAVRILGFEDAQAAWDELSRTDPDLFITDITHPGLSCKEMLARLAERKISYPILIISAFENAEWRRWGPGLRVSFLPKPFLVEEFQRAVESALCIHAQRTP